MGGSVDKAVTEARRMILEEKIKYVTVGIHSGAAVAVGNLGKEYKVLMNGGFATTKRLTGEAGHDYVGARQPLDGRDRPRNGRVPEVAPGRLKRVAMIAPDYEYGQHFVRTSRRPEGGASRHHRRAQEMHKLGATDFGPHVTALQAQPVDLVVGGMFGADLINFLRSARDFDLFRRQDAVLHHGLDLAKMGSLKDLVPPNTMGYGVVSVLCHRHGEVEGLHRRNRKTHEDLSRRSDASRLRRWADDHRGDPQVGYCRRRGSGRKALGTVAFEGPTGPTKVRACDNMAMYDFYVGNVKLDANCPTASAWPTSRRSTPSRLRAAART